MRILKLVPIFLLSAFFFPLSAFAYDYQEDFTGYSVAVLNGQNSWVADSRFTVNGSYELYASGGSTLGTATQLMPGVTDLRAQYGEEIIMSFDMKTSATSNTAYVGVYSSAGQSICNAGVNASSLTMAGNTTVTTSLSGSGFVVNTWYTYNLHLDFSNQTCYVEIPSLGLSTASAYMGGYASPVGTYPIDTVRVLFRYNNSTFDNITIGDSTPAYSATSTRIIATSPELTTDYVSASTTVTFDIDYFSNVPDIDEVCVILQDLTTYQSINASCDDVTASGERNFTVSRTFNEDAFIMWQVHLRYEGNPIIVSDYGYMSIINQYESPYSPYYSSFVATTAVATSTPVGDMTFQCDPDAPFFENSVCNLALLLFVPGQDSLQQMRAALAELNSKLPFSAFYEFKSAFDGVTRVPEDVSQATLSLTFFSEDMALISTSSLQTITGQENSTSIFRYWISVALWISLALFAYRRAQRLFSSS